VGTPWLAVPLADASGSTGPCAIVVLGGAGGPFNTEDESVMVLLAQMASVALVNARLYQAVQSNEHRLRAVVESSPLAIAEVDLTAGRPWWNGAASALFGWEDGSDGARRVSGDEAAVSVLEELWGRTAHGVASVGTDLETTGPNGKTLELSVSTAPLFDHEGSVTGILVVAEDVTERRRMLEQFHQAERLGAMARLAGGVAHDFNNLLTVILGSSEVLLRRADADAEWRDDVAAIQRAGERAAALTSQLLAIGHRRPVQSVVVDPDAVMESMRPMITRLLGKDVELVLVPGSTQGRILADPAELERALLNMVINARDAMPEGGRIEFTHQGDGGRSPRIVAGRRPHGVGQRGRDGSRDRRALLRALLHHQGPGPGDRPRVGRRARHGDPGRRPHHGGVRRGPGHHLHLCGSRRPAPRSAVEGRRRRSASSTGAMR
jgi:PAS domain S-box-containing protein